MVFCHLLGGESGFAAKPHNDHGGSTWDGSERQSGGKTLGS